jgi:hypothetical protein
MYMERFTVDGTIHEVEQFGMDADHWNFLEKVTKLRVLQGFNYWH